MQAINSAQASIGSFNASASFCLAQGYDSPLYNQSAIRDLKIKSLLSVLKAFIVMDAGCEMGVGSLEGVLNASSASNLTNVCAAASEWQTAADEPVAGWEFQIT